MPDPLAGQIGDRPDARVGQHHELERRVVHRKQRPLRAELLSASPVAGAVPSLLRDAERDERQLDLAGFEQLEVFDRPFGRPHADGQAELAGQQPREPFAIGVVGAAGRSGADRERARPMRLGRPGAVIGNRDDGARVRSRCDPARTVVKRVMTWTPAHVVTGLGGPAALISSSTSTCSGVSASASVSLLRCALHPLDVERAFPARDHDRRDAVADEVGERARFRHEAVDAEDQRHAGDRDRADRRQRRGQRDEARAGDAGGALRGQQQDADDAELLRES